MNESLSSGGVFIASQPDPPVSASTKKRSRKSKSINYVRIEDDLIDVATMQKISSDLKGLFYSSKKSGSQQTSDSGGSSTSSLPSVSGHPIAFPPGSPKAPALIPLTDTLDVKEKIIVELNDKIKKQAEIIVQQEELIKLLRARMYQLRVKTNNSFQEEKEEEDEKEEKEKVERVMAAVAAVAQVDSSDFLINQLDEIINSGSEDEDPNCASPKMKPLHLNSLDSMCRTPNPMMSARTLQVLAVLSNPTPTPTPSSSLSSSSSSPSSSPLPPTSPSLSMSSLSLSLMPTSFSSSSLKNCAEPSSPEITSRMAAAIAAIATTTTTTGISPSSSLPCLSNSFDAGLTIGSRMHRLDSFLLRKHFFNSDILVVPCVGYEFETGNEVFDFKEFDNQCHFIERFIGRSYVNLASLDTPMGPAVFSISRDDRIINILTRTSDGVQLKLMPYYPGEKVTPKSIFKQIQPNFVGYEKKFKIYEGPEVERSLIRYEIDQTNKRFKFGVLLVKPGQFKEQEMFENPDTTGQFSVFANFQDNEIMFHVSTLLPFVAGDEQQLERKRHIGNDIVVLIFLEPGASFKPNCISSNFIHVLFIIQPVFLHEDHEVTHYRVVVARKENVKPFGPLLPTPSYIHKDDLRGFLYEKLVNAELSCYESPDFESKLRSTRGAVLKSIIESHQNFCSSAKKKSSLV